MKAPNWKVILAGFLFISCLFLIHGYRVYELFRDIVAMQTPIGPGGSAMPGSPTPVPAPFPLLDGLKPRIRLPYTLINLLPTTYGKDLLSSASFTQKVQELGNPQEADAERDSRELLSRVKMHMASIPVIPPNPPIIVFGSNPSRYREIRETGKYWVILARLMAPKNRQDAWNMLTGPFLLAHQLEAREAGGPSGLSLIGKMIALALRRMASIACMEILSEFPLEPVFAREFAARIELFETQAASLSQAIGAEKGILPGIYRELEVTPPSEIVLKYRRPLNGIRRCLEPTRLNPLLEKFHGRYEKACGLPFAKGQRLCSEVATDLELLSDKWGAPSIDLLPYFFRPEDAALEFLFSLSVPNLRKVLEQEFLLIMQMRGVRIGLAANAFYLEKKEWPKSLPQLETWWGKPLPQDVFINAPLQFISGSPPQIKSVGPDILPGTGDDLTIVPYGL